MDREEAVKQAFLEAYNGYSAALAEVKDPAIVDIHLAELAPVAAEIYRQMTSQEAKKQGSKASGKAKKRTTPMSELPGSKERIEKAITFPTDTSKPNPFKERLDPELEK